MQQRKRENAIKYLNLTLYTLCVFVSLFSFFHTENSFLLSFMHDTYSLFTLQVLLFLDYQIYDFETLFTTCRASKLKKKKKKSQNR